MMPPSSIAAWVKPPCGKAGPRSPLLHDRPPEAHSPGPRNRPVRTEQVGIAAARRHGGEQEERHDSSVPSHDRGAPVTAGSGSRGRQEFGAAIPIRRLRSHDRKTKESVTKRAMQEPHASCISGTVREHARRSIYAENNRAESRRKLFPRILRKILVSCASHRTKRSRHFHNLHSTNPIRRTRTA